MRRSVGSAVAGGTARGSPARGARGAPTVDRRSFLKTSAAVALGGGVLMPTAGPPHIAVIGAGAFGGWTALFLRRQGARVTLLDAWGPGNSRASSGGETRVTRSAYGPRAVYTRMAARALALWKEHQTQWHRQLYHGIGVLWLVESDEQYEKAALPILRDAHVAFEELQGAELARRFPQINCEQVRWAIFEKDAGYLTARRACAAVLEGFIAEGGEYRQLALQAPIEPRGGELSSVTLSDGSRLTADRFVFACGPWLGSLFPDVIGERVRATRQEVFFFGTPSGDRRYTEEALPVWADHGTRFIYGIPGNEWRGFKVADDSRGPVFDPTNGERTPTAAALQIARDYIAYRFPGLKGAPLLESRVCQYEESPDEHFIIDHHPQAANAWLP